jgi:hypothetical protein
MPARLKSCFAILPSVSNETAPGSPTRFSKASMKSSPSRDSDCRRSCDARSHAVRESLLLIVARYDDAELYPLGRRLCALMRCGTFRQRSRKRGPCEHCVPTHDSPPQLRRLARAFVLYPCRCVARYPHFTLIPWREQPVQVPVRTNDECRTTRPARTYRSVFCMAVSIPKGRSRRFAPTSGSASDYGILPPPTSSTCRKR